MKDHDITPTELKSVVEAFRRSDEARPDLYDTFTLACTSLSATARPIETALARLRGVTPFYADVPEALIPTKEDLRERSRSIGLEDHVDFILSKVHFEIGLSDLRDDTHAGERFMIRMQALPEYADMPRSRLEPVFANVLRTLSTKRGITMGRGHLEALLEAGVREAEPKPEGVAIWIHNWTNEVFDLEPVHVLDWSKYFDRPTRRVPAAETWNGVLIPELRMLHTTILASRKERLIQLRGKCALSTGLAVGVTFPGVGGWTFELPQPPSIERWQSSAARTDPYELDTETVIGDPGSNQLVLGLNIKGDARDEVITFARDRIRPALYAFAGPRVQGGEAIRGAADACAFAIETRQFLGRLLKQHRIGRTHVFFYGPLALAVFLGQQLTSVGELQLYEYQDPGYVESCVLRT